MNHIDPADTIVLTLPIQALPDCYEKEQLLRLAYVPSTEVIIVAVAGYANDWSAYIGYPMHVKPEFAEQAQAYFNLRNAAGVLSNGDKVAVDLAKHLFGNLFSGRSYRP